DYEPFQVTLLLPLRIADFSVFVDRDGGEFGDGTRPLHGARNGSAVADRNRLVTGLRGAINSAEHQYDPECCKQTRLYHSAPQIVHDCKKSATKRRVVKERLLFSLPWRRPSCFVSSCSRPRPRRPTPSQYLVATSA